MARAYDAMITATAVSTELPVHTCNPRDFTGMDGLQILRFPTTSHTIRPALASDLDRIKEIAVAAEMFTAEEAEFFDEMFHGALDGSLEGHQWVVVETSDGSTVSAAQFAPEPFADRMWNLYFIAVDPTAQRTGIGTAVMAHVEADLKQRGADQARTLVVETSSTDQYTHTREFYAGLGYDEEARIREFYGPNDHKVVFWKSVL